MSNHSAISDSATRIAARADELFALKLHAIYVHADRQFCLILSFQYFAAICVALWISPLAWDGDRSEVHVHVWAATILGAAIISRPILLALLRPGHAATRHIISIAQMLMGALLIHLTGGHIETHFHVFGSLALLTAYRDWRVLISASVVVAVDHLLRSWYWPQSDYGLMSGAEWRWLEHAGWVVFEDVFLIYYCIRGSRELRLTKLRRAELEERNACIEEAVQSRTKELAESEARFRNFVDHATDAFFLLNDKAVVLDVNRQACVSLGCTPEELIGTTPLDFDPDVTREMLDKVYEQFQHGASVALDTRHRRKDGTTFPVEVRARSFTEGGRFFAVCLVRDITERQRAEQALSASQKRYAGLVNNLDAIVWEMDAPTRTFRFVSHQAERILGYSTERWLHEPEFWIRHVQPDDRARAMQFRMDTASVGDICEYRMLGADDRVVWLRDCVAVEMADGKPTTLRGVMVDITAQKRIEMALRESEEKLRTIVDNEPECVKLVDREGRLLEMNAAGLRMVEAASLDQVRGLACNCLVADCDRQAFDDMVAAVFRGEARQLTFEMRSLGGADRMLETHSVPLWSPDRSEVRAMLGVTRDITERKRVEAELRISIREKEAMLKEVHHRVKNNLQIISSLLNLQIPKIKDPESLAAFQDSQNRVHSMALNHETLYRSGNLAAIRLPDYVDTLCSILSRSYGVKGKKIEFSVDVADTALNLDSAIPCGLIINELVSNALKYAFPENRSGRISVRMQPASEKDFVLSVEDDGIGLPAGLELEQLDSLGLNLVSDLTGQLGGTLQIFVSGEWRVVTSDFRACHRIQEIAKAGDRATKLTRQLLAFSRQQILQTRVLNLNDLITDFQRMMGRLIGENITLTTKLSPDLEAVQVDPGQIEQVLMNLAVNSRDAMPNGGRIMIETANSELDADYAKLRPEVIPGRYAMIAVSDTGCGMDRATQTRVFEPFFTTKEAGKGSGLGLATVYGIVKQSGGYIYVYSEVGHGTTVRVYLPIVAAAAEVVAAPKATEPPPNEAETVLLVEDEEGVRNLLRTTLEDNGYSVFTAWNGKDALHVAKKFGGPIQLLLTDVVMPEMGGRELAEHFAGLYPQTRVLFMSGYTDDMVMRDGVLQAGVDFLQKPYTMAALMRKVRAVLDRDENLIPKPNHVICGGKVS